MTADQRIEVTIYDPNTGEDLARATCAWDPAWGDAPTRLPVSNEAARLLRSPVVRIDLSPELR